MADDIDFPSGSCKQDVTDLICLSAHLNLNRRLEVAEKERLREARSEGMRETFTQRRSLLFGHVCESQVFPPFLRRNHLILPGKHRGSV